MADRLTKDEIIEALSKIKRWEILDPSQVSKKTFDSKILAELKSFVVKAKELESEGRLTIDDSVAQHLTLNLVDPKDSGRSPKDRD